MFNGKHFEVNKNYICVVANSKFYSVGRVYKCEKDETGTYFKANDGLKDYHVNLLSKFKETK